MIIISSTDSKYIGTEVSDSIKVGDLVSLGDFQLEVQFVRQLENGRICVGFPNYQIVLEV